VDEQNMSKGARALVVPLARPPVMADALSRPDWTVSTARDPALLWLDRNENPDPELLAVTREVLAGTPAEALFAYPDCSPLYHRLATYVGLGADHLLLCAGSDGAIRSVFEAYVSPGDVVLHTTPTFAMYPVYAQMYGAIAATVAYRASERGPVLAAADFIAAIQERRPRVVCLPNPDSPTGTVFLPADLRAIIEAAGDVGSVMLVDEAYYPFHEGTAAPWVDEYPHVVVARTFAKAWGLAGLRIGYTVACPALTRLLHKVRPMYEVNAVAVFAIQRMLEHVDAMQASVRRLIAGRELFRGAMQQLGLNTPETHGNFLHVSFGSLAPAVHDALASLVLYRRDFGDLCLKGYSRFSAGTEEQMRLVADRVRSVAAARR
jgi:histidinol-phosphate aminotransferase